MKSETYELAPNGDTDLLLQKPNEQTLFGPDAARQLMLLEIDQRLAVQLETHIDSESDSGSESETEKEPQAGAGLEPEPAAEPEDKSRALVVLKQTNNEPQCGVEQPPGDSHVEAPAIRMRVSSEHLMLASPIFRKMLTGPWKESITTTSPRVVPASEWDTTALIMVLDIIHGHHWDLPESPSLETLAKFAVIVDYYQCHEVVDIFVDRWLTKLETDLPIYHGKASVLWLCISWVFSRPKTFNAVTELALRHQDCPIGPVGLPIAALLEKIDQRRQELITSFLSQLSDLGEALCKDEIGCSFECSCMLLGVLMKEMQNIGHLSPPFNGYSITSVMQMIGKVKAPKWYSFNAKLQKPRKREHSCGLAEPIHRIKEGIETGLKGFILDDFPYSNRKRQAPCSEVGVNIRSFF